MSEDEKPLEFSARDLMPDWAQEKPREPRPDFAKRFGGDGERRDRPDRERREDRREGGRRDDRRGGGPRGDTPRGDDRRGGFGGRGERRDTGSRNDRGDRGGRFDRDRPRGDRREGDRAGWGGGRRERFPEDRPAEGVTVSIEPSGPAVEGLNRHIRETFRSFPLGDLAKLVLAARERYRVRFTAAAPVKLYQCQADGSVWLTREEAIAHLLSGPALEAYYTAEDIEVAAPTGNFGVIAVCGMSGVILGPPNHHEYQRNIARLHRERFADMPLERFKSRIRMESGEEILEKWREQVSRVRQYRVKSAEEPSAETAEAEREPEAPADEAVLEESAEAAAVDGSDLSDVSDLPDEVAEAETADEASETEAASAEPEEPAPAPPAADRGPVFKSIEEVARHFRQHFAGEAVLETSEAVVPGNIPGRLLSPGLLVLLKQETEKLRHGFPLALVQSLCRAFEEKGLRFFKRGKKSLHVAAVRPRALEEGVNLTGAIQVIVDYVKGAPRPTVAGLLEALVPGFKRPEGPAIEESPEWSDAARAVLKDLRWLTAEGYVLEFPDTGLAMGRLAPGSAAPVSAPAPAPAPPQEKSAKAKSAKSAKATPSEPAALAPARDEEEGGGADAPALPAFPVSEDDPDPDDPSGLPESVNPVVTF